MIAGLLPSAKAIGRASSRLAKIARWARDKRRLYVRLRRLGEEINPYFHVPTLWAPQRERVKMTKKLRHERVPSHYGQRGEAAGFKFLLSALKPPLAKSR
jgi:hypothetical protein